MKQPWSEPVLMIALSLLAVGAILGVSWLARKPGLDADSDIKSLTEEVRRLRQENNSNIQQVKKRLTDLEATVRDLQERSRPEGKAFRQDPDSDSVETVDVVLVPGADLVKGAKARGLLYAGRGEFNPRDHNRVLSDLVAAYAVRGLSAEDNASLLAAIQQVNEIGVAQVIAEAGALPPSEATRQLKAFLQGTPKLTSSQRERIRAELRRLEEG